MMHRREVLGGLFAFMTGSELIPKWAFAQSAQPVNRAAATRGTPAQERAFAAVHPIMEKLLLEFEIAGASLAIAHAGRLVVSKGYGLANVAKRVPVQPDTLFSIASVTKAITGVAVLKLVDAGKLELDARLVDVLHDLKPLPGKRIADARFRNITVHHLLYHAGGFPGHVKSDQAEDIDMEGEDTDKDADIALRYRTLMSEPLEFAPGSQSHYSNIGFLVLRLVIEHAAGEGYEEYVRAKLLKPRGITRMHLETEGNYEPNEAHRYQAGGRKPARRMVANWLASATDLVHFLVAVDGGLGQPFLSKKARTAMLAAPLPPNPKRPNAGHVGLGWDVVRQFPEGHRYAKSGGKPGIQAWLEHMENGVDWAFLYNTNAPNGRSSRGETVKRMHEAFQKIVAKLH
ncbi:MAG TPA: serine hydrolase domain-containing protein [Gemmataceae bacterium]|nr:serine hydrolase domain-containing protein [Gemmataceae bacterium]